MLLRNALVRLEKQGNPEKTLHLWNQCIHFQVPTFPIKPFLEGKDALMRENTASHAEPGAVRGSCQEYKRTTLEDPDKFEPNYHQVHRPLELNSVKCRQC
jgi:hypothetical protein